MNTDRAWEIWGSKEPYYAVLTTDEFLRDKLDDAQREEFFRTGSAHVQHVLKQYTTLRGDAARFESALDFGCGVGRLVIPLAERFHMVTGVDVSRSMLEEATRNGGRAAQGNIRLLQTAEFLADSAATGYDLVHSVLVFQHLRARRSEGLLAELLSRLAPGGMAAIQLIFAERGAAQALAGLRYRIPFAQPLVRLLRGRPIVAPMEMNPSDLGTIFAIFQDHGLSNLQVALGWMGHIRSINIFALKTAPR